jgi:hypothetical protein
MKLNFIFGNFEAKVARVSAFLGGINRPIKSTENSVGDFWIGLKRFRSIQ